MSRVTPSSAKITQAIRGISSTACPARSSALLDSPARHAAYLPRRVTDLKVECSKRKLPTSGTKAELVDRLAANDLTRSHSTLGGRRPMAPQTPTATTSATFRFMQGFQTSAPKAATHDVSGIDFFFFPEMPEAPAANPFSKLRVPLLPDNYSPDRSAKSGNAVETLDEAVPRPEIIIVASHPDVALPAAMTELADNETVEVGLSELTKQFTSTKAEEDKEPGMVKELWASFLDDVLGAHRKHKATA